MFFKWCQIQAPQCQLWCWFFILDGHNHFGLTAWKNPIVSFVCLFNHSQMLRRCLNFIKSLAGSQSPQALDWAVYLRGRRQHELASAQDTAESQWSLLAFKHWRTLQRPTRDILSMILSLCALIAMGRIWLMMKRANLPNYAGGDQLQQGSKQERETLHEVQSCWVQRVEEDTAHQKTQTLHASNCGKQGTYEKNIYVSLYNLELILYPDN